MIPDFLVIGAGVAGLRAAIELAPAGRVLVVAKDSLRESSSAYAQGGIAAALSDDDEVELHEQDTLAAGDGLCNPEAVRLLVEEGPEEIRRLIEWGTEFDREGTRLAFTREGAHSRNRILHAHGDSTGREIARALYHKAVSLQNVSFRSFAATTDLLVGDGEVTGAVLYDANANQRYEMRAHAVLLATGGLGRVFSNTTNPDVATGDGVAMAWRAGATISDIEFVQFHPTALYVEGAPRFLLSEAMRGEGARLLNSAGERFMQRYHKLAELAPRDVVSRAIVAEMQRTGADHVSLDISHRGADFIKERFPRVYETCKHYGVDLAAGPAPIQPAAHYAMGGVATDMDGRTSLPRLFAAGEVAATGVHGANRLASNSLLEGVVFGARAGRAMRELAAGPAPRRGTAAPVEVPAVSEREIRDLAWECCGILRSGEGLRRAIATLEESAQGGKRADSAHESVIRSLHQVALLIARCAEKREESRGAHYRLDFPAPHAEFARHSLATPGGEIRFA